MTAQNRFVECYPIEMTVHSLFEQQVRKTPEQIAAEYCGETISYEGLNNKAEKLADRLRAQGVAPDCVIGLCVERSIRMIIGVLGIMKSGAAYLPINPQDPRQRVEFMLKDSAVLVLVSEKGIHRRFDWF